MLVADDPGCGFVIWKKKAGKTLPVSVAKELIESLRAVARARRRAAVGRTEKPVTGFRGRSGRTFRAKLKLEQDDEGKWRVDFDEEWARQPCRPRRREEADAAAEEAIAAKNGPATPNRRSPSPSAPRTLRSSTSSSSDPARGGPRRRRAEATRPASRGSRCRRRSGRHRSWTQLPVFQSRVPPGSRHLGGVVAGSGPARWVWPKMTWSASTPSGRRPRRSPRGPRGAAPPARDVGAERAEAGGVERGDAAGIATRPISSRAQRGPRPPPLPPGAASRRRARDRCAASRLGRGRSGRARGRARRSARHRLVVGRASRQAGPRRSEAGPSPAATRHSTRGTVRWTSR